MLELPRMKNKSCSEGSLRSLKFISEDNTQRIKDYFDQGRLQ